MDNLPKTPARTEGSQRCLVRDDLPSRIGTVLSTRPLSDEEKAAVEADVMEARKQIIAELREEGIL